jgi:hypothetical protein
MTPVALPEFLRHQQAALLFLEGLALHYAECLALGKIDLWRNAAHGCVDLACDLQGLEVVNRKDLSFLGWTTRGRHHTLAPSTFQGGCNVQGRRQLRVGR